MDNIEIKTGNAHLASDDAKMTGATVVDKAYHGPGGGEVEGES